MIKEIYHGLTYFEYLCTDHWIAIRAVAIREAGFQCELCGSGIKIEVHHKNYKRLGNETLKDLIVLCKKCHKGKHGRRCND